MSEDWISSVWLNTGEALIFGEDKDGHPFREFVREEGAEHIARLEAKQGAEMRKLLTSLVAKEAA